jgi:hypothetical protein
MWRQKPDARRSRLLAAAGSYWNDARGMQVRDEKTGQNRVPGWLLARERSPSPVGQPLVVLRT